MAKYNGWLLLIYEILIFIFEKQPIEFGFLEEFFFSSLHNFFEVLFLSSSKSLSSSLGPI